MRAAGRFSPLGSRAMNQSSQALRLNPQKLRAATLPDRNLLLVGFLRHGGCAGEGRGGGCVRPTASARPSKFYAPKRLQTPSRCRNLVIFSSLRRRALGEAPIGSPLSKARAPVRRDALFGAAACKRSAMAFLPSRSSVSFLCFLFSGRAAELARFGGLSCPEIRFADPADALADLLARTSGEASCISAGESLYVSDFAVGLKTAAANRPSFDLSRGKFCQKSRRTSLWPTDKGDRLLL